MPIIREKVLSELVLKRDTFISTNVGKILP